MKHANRKSKVNKLTSEKLTDSFSMRPLSAAICALMAVPGFVSPIASAQQSDTLEEVIVTARKRSESVTDVPVSISALSGDALNAAGITTLTGLFAVVPGVDNNADGSRIANKPAIRGIGSQENASVRQKVATFIDGMPLIGAQGIGSFAGLERVEVIRGPQSAAFGRSTFGGAINYVTRDPGQELELNLRASFAGDGARNLSGVFSSPLGDKFGVIATLEEKNYNGDDEWVTTSGVQLGGLNDKMGSIKLRFDPSDSFSGELMYMRQEVDDDHPPSLFANLDQVEPHPEDSDGMCAINGGGNSCVIIGGVDDIAQIYEYDFDNLRNPILDPGTRIERDRIQGSISLNFDNGASLTVLASHTEEEGVTWLDRDAFTGGMAIHAASTPESDEDYIELRYSSPSENRLGWLIGASFYEYDYNNTVFNNLTTGAIMGLFNEGAKNTGVFASLNYEVNERFTASLEGRYQIDEVSGTYATNPDRGVFADISEEDETTSFQPRLGLTYAISESTNLYFQAALGNNPAAFNTVLFDPIMQEAASSEGLNLEAFQTFDEEEILNYEIGLKAVIPDWNLRYSAALYYLDWEGYVQPTTLDWTPEDGELLPGTTGNDYFQRVFLNTGDLDGFGFEFEGQWAATEELVVGGMFSYSGLEFTDDACSPIPLNYGVPAIELDPYACASVEGAQLPMTSKYSAAVNATYTMQFSNGYEGYARFDYQYKSKRYTEQINTDYLPSFDLVNLRFGVRSDSWSVELFGNNIFDEDSPAGAVRFFDSRQPGMVFNTTVRQRRPRSVGIALNYDI